MITVSINIFVTIIDTTSYSAFSRWSFMVIKKTIHEIGARRIEHRDFNITVHLANKMLLKTWCHNE